MATLGLEEIEQDPLVMSVARAFAVANEAAIAEGSLPSESLVTISEETSSMGEVWRFHYGPRDYVNCRGGDLMVFVDKRSALVKRILRGQ